MSGHGTECSQMHTSVRRAVAKITASWGVDYMLLGKYGNTWQIQQILV